MVWTLNIPRLWSRLRSTLCGIRPDHRPPRRSRECAPQRLVDRYAQLNNGTGAWAMVEKETEQIVGTLLLKQLPDNEGKPTQDYEVGWHLRKASWGKGYATEAGIAAIDYGFNVLKLPVIYVVVRPENHASIRVAQRLAMMHMGRTHKYYGVELELFKLDAEQKALVSCSC